MFFSPFEQFEITVLLPYNILGHDISVTNMTIYLFLTFFIITFIFSAITNNLTFYPNLWQSLIEITYKFILGLIIDQAGIKAQRYFPALCSIFLFIIILNLLGLTPFGFTPTGHIVVTFCLSLSFSFAWIIIGLIKLKLQFFQIFLPRNVPTWLMPLLIVIEILSFFIRPLSLAIRLFANMLAGHILLFIIAGSVFVLAKMFVLFSILPIIAVLAFLLLEAGIAFLQAYVFTLLLCIYLSDAINVHK